MNPDQTVTLAVAVIGLLGIVVTFVGTRGKTKTDAKTALDARTDARVKAELERVYQRLDDVERAAVALLLLLVVTLLSWAAFVAAGYPPIDGLLEVASAVSTVGLSSGITGPDLAPGLKLLLCLDMLMGRLEIVAMLVLVYPPTWNARRAEAA